MSQHGQGRPLQWIWHAGGVILLALVLVYTPVIDTWAALKSSLSSVTWDRSRFRTHLATPNAGIEVLPPQVQEMRAILDRHPQITEYGMSQSLQDSVLIYQRAVEGLWPRKPVPTAPYQFILLTEAEQYAQCIEVAGGKEIALVRCD